MKNFTSTYWLGWLWIAVAIVDLTVFHNKIYFAAALATGAIFFEINNVRVDIRNAADRKKQDA